MLHRASIFALFCGIAISTAVVSCGTGDATNLFGPNRDAGLGGEGTGSSAEATTSGSGESTSGPGSTSAQSSTAQASSAAQSSSSSASTAASSSSGGGDGSVYCKNAPCAQGQVCCFHDSDPNQDHCGTQGTCGDMFSELSCNSPDDCPGQTCCGYHPGNNYQEISCKPTCTGPADILMCQDDPSVCGGGQCKQSVVLGTGYMYCE